MLARPNDIYMKTKYCSGCKSDRPLDEFRFYLSGPRANTPTSICRDCEHVYRITRPKSREYYRTRAHITGKNRPIEEARDTGNWLGIYVAERVLSHYFEGITRMPFGNHGFDFICKNGFKIDAKSSCLNHRPHRNQCWHFNTFHNVAADYFLCLAFDDRENMAPMHVWLVPSGVVANKTGFNIIDVPWSLSEWSQYEKPINKVLSCCATFRSKLPELL
jgi:hypothetical protein